MPKVSIIVPVYDVEQHLPACIDSVLAQTFTDFELILVDDGSSDSCGSICDEYAARDSRIRVIHQENRGVSAARNTGLNVSGGLFTFFLDSDDLISPSCLELLCSIQALTDADIVIADREKFRPEDTVHFSVRPPEDTVIVDSRGFFEIGQNRRMVTGQMYRTARIKSFRFDPGYTLGEDSIFNFSVLLGNPDLKVAVYKGIVYHWRIRDGSAFHREGGVLAYYCVGKWCLETYQSRRRNAEKGWLQDKLLLEAMKELLLFRKRDQGHLVRAADLRAQIKKAAGFLLTEPTISVRNKCRYLLMSSIPAVYSAVLKYR